MRSILSNKKGQMSGSNPLGLVIGLVVGICFLIFIYFALQFGITILNPSGFFAVGSASANSTNDIQNNLTNGVSLFAGYLPTIFKIIALVVILGFLGLMIGGIYLLMKYGRQ